MEGIYAKTDLDLHTADSSLSILIIKLWYYKSYGFAVFAISWAI